MVKSIVWICLIVLFVIVFCLTLSAQKMSWSEYWDAPPSPSLVPNHGVALQGAHQHMFEGVSSGNSPGNRTMSHPSRKLSYVKNHRRSFVIDTFSQVSYYLICSVQIFTIVNGWVMKSQLNKPMLPVSTCWCREGLAGCHSHAVPWSFPQFFKDSLFTVSHAQQ